MCELCNEFELYDIYPNDDNGNVVVFKGKKQCGISLPEGHLDYWIEIGFVRDETDEADFPSATLWVSIDMIWDKKINIHIEDSKYTQCIPTGIDDFFLLDSIVYCPRCGKDLTKIKFQDVKGGISGELQKVN